MSPKAVLLGAALASVAAGAAPRTLPAGPLGTLFVQPHDDQGIRPPQEVFVPSARRDADGAIAVTWAIEPGHYLYRDTLDFRLEPTTLPRLGTPEFPPAVVVDDPHFGTTAIYREAFRVRIPLRGDAPSSAAGGVLKIRYQGCVEGRLCYPPVTADVPVESTEASP